MSGYFDKYIWNHYESDGLRTNNLCEGYNSKMKKYTNTTHPDIYKAIRLLQRGEA